MFLPLAFDISKFNAISEQVIDDNVSLGVDAFTKVGIGIASIFLLIFVISSITALLDGGKFQMKMLWPVLVYFIVCHFTWVSKPVVGFTETITKELCTGLVSAKADLITQKSNGKASSLAGLFWYLKKKDMGYTDEQLDEITAILEGRYEEYKTANGEHLSENDLIKYGAKKGSLIQQIRFAVNQFWNGWKMKLAKAMDDTPVHEVGENEAGPEIHATYTPDQLTGLGLFVMFMNMMCSFVSLALRSVGIIMTVIIVCFGPITFAFAVWPGRHQMMMTWFLRLCQFSLYGPICLLVDVIAIDVFCVMLDPSGGGDVVSFIGILGIMVADIVALTSVPSIASMIIEGASGSLSLSQGLQTATGVAGMVAGATGLKALGRFAGKRKDDAKQLLMGLGQHDFINAVDKMRRRNKSHGSKGSGGGVAS